MLRLFLSCISIGNEIFTQYLLKRQYRALSSPYDETIASLFSKDEFIKSCSYNKDKLSFSRAKSIFDTLLNIVILCISEDAFAFFKKNISSSDAIFLTLFMLITSLFSIPWEFYFDFVVEQKHGFNKKTVKIFLKDLFISKALATTLSYFVFGIMKYIVSVITNFEYPVTVFIFILQITMLWIYPTFITPLFFKVKALEKNNLSEMIDSMATKVGFNCDKIEVIDGSTRSGHSNAYFVGLGKIKRIVFFDTLLNQMDDKEIVSILCHELGHWKYNHILKRLLSGLLVTFFYLFTFRKSIAYQKQDKQLNTNFIYFSNILGILGYPVSYLTNAISRSHERQADEFAVLQGYGDELISGLIKLSKGNLATPVADKLYSAFTFSHPHVLERIEFIKKAMKKKD